MADIGLKRRQLFYQNLIMLGFDESLVAKRYQIKCDKDMFAVPNKKGFEVVTYFLFSKLNELSSQEACSIPWPILDREQEKAFRGAVFTNLSNVAKNSNVRFPNFQLSFFLSPGGDRFYKLYLVFSSHVLEVHVQKMGKVQLLGRPSDSQRNKSVAHETLKLATLNCMSEFHEVQSLILENYQYWKKCANDLLVFYQNVKQSLASKSNLLSEKKKILSICTEEESTELPVEDLFNKSIVFERKVKKYWKTLESFLNQDKELWDKLYRAVEEDLETYILDGSKYKLQVPDSVLTNCSDELKQIGFCGLEEDNKLSIIGFLKLFLVSFEHYLKTVKKAGAPCSEELCPQENHLRDLKENTELINTLSKSLVMEIIPSMEAKLKELKACCLTDNLLEGSELLCAKFPAASPTLDPQARILLPEPGTMFAPTTEAFLSTDNFPNKDTQRNTSELSKDNKLVSDALTVNPQNLLPNENSCCQLENTSEGLKERLSDVKLSENSFFSPVGTCHIPQLHHHCTDTKEDASNIFEESRMSLFSPDSVFEHSRNSFSPDAVSEFDICTRNTSFKMRESWLEEDSLVSITFPTAPI